MAELEKAGGLPRFLGVNRDAAPLGFSISCHGEARSRVGTALMRYCRQDSGILLPKLGPFSKGTYFANTITGARIKTKLAISALCLFPRVSIENIISETEIMIFPIY